MRKRTGDSILVFNDDEEWLSKCFFEDKLKLNPEKLLRNKENIKDIWICFGLVKTKNIDLLVEKVSEIGVRKIYPMITSFSNRIPLNYERLKKISIEAVEQSNSLFIPIIGEVKSIKEILNNWEEDRLIIFCDEKDGIDISKINRKEYKFKKIAIFIGPVGGWSDEDEISCVILQNSYTPCTPSSRCSRCLTTFPIELRGSASRTTSPRGRAYCGRCASRMS